MTEPVLPPADAPAEPPVPPVPDRVVLRTERGTLFVAIVFLLGALPLATSHVALLPLLALPVGCLVWLRRARVVADRTGLTICNGWRTRRVAWTDVQGFDLSGPRRIRLLEAGHEPRALAGLQRRDLPRLLAVSAHAGQCARRAAADPLT